MFAVCERCDNNIGQDAENAYGALLARQFALRSLGPLIAKKWCDESPFVDALQLACPHCGHAIRTEQKLKGERQQIYDYLLARK